MVFLVVFLNVLTLLTLFLVHHGFTIINQSATGQELDDQIQRFIEENSCIGFTGTSSRIILRFLLFFKIDLVYHN